MCPYLFLFLCNIGHIWCRKWSSFWWGETEANSTTCLPYKVLRYPQNCDSDQQNGWSDLFTNKVDFLCDHILMIFSLFITRCLSMSKVLFVHYKFLLLRFMELKKSVVDVLKRAGYDYKNGNKLLFFLCHCHMLLFFSVSFSFVARLI